MINSMIRKLSSKLSSKWIVPVYVTTLASMIFIQCPKKQYKLNSQDDWYKFI